MLFSESYYVQLSKELHPEELDKHDDHERPEDQLIFGQNLQFSI